MKWSKYQQDIFKNVKSGTGHTIVNALAGCGKSTTIVQSFKYIPRGNKTLMVAFNKSIADELRERAPSYVDCLTLHSLGLRAIKKHFGDDIVIDNSKCDNIVLKELDNLIKAKKLKDKSEKFELSQNICQCISLCKATLSDSPKSIENIINDYDIEIFSLDIKDFISLVIKCLGECKKDTSCVDFNDMIWFPFVFRLKLNTYDYVFVDECFPYKQYIATDTGKEQIGVLVNKFKKGKDLPLVKSFNEKTKKFEYSKIVNAWNRGKKELFEIKSGKRKIKCTSNHKFLTNKGWIETSNLKPGYLIKTSEPGCGQMQLALNDDQEQVVIGSFLGDGSIQKTSNYRYRMKVIHGKDQKNYCSWKADMFHCSIKHVKNNGFSKKDAYTFATKTFSLGYDFPKSKSTCPQWVLDKLDARGLAIWFMDDGSVGKSYATISTCSFDEDSQKRMVKKLKEMGINCKYVSYSGYYYIIIFADGLKKLTDIIGPYIYSNMEYKVKGIKNKYKWNHNYENYGYSSVDYVKKTGKSETVYDIEVENNHNFIVCASTATKLNTNGGLIAHNCQDINKAQMYIIMSSCKKNGRIIIVMDPNQAIYSWRGADPKNLFNLIAKLNAKTFSLPISYRCAKKIIYEAQKVAPNITHAPNAIDGTVEHISDSNFLSKVKPGDFILSRTNAPLIKYCLKLLKNNVPANIQGRDIGKNLIWFIKKSKKKTIKGVISYTEKWLENEIVKAKSLNRGYEYYINKADCIYTLCEAAEGAKSTDDLISVIKKLFDDVDDFNKVVLSTSHRSKGLERKKVFILSSTFRFNKYDKSNSEENRIWYVAVTRAKEELYFVYKNKVE